MSAPAANPPMTAPAPQPHRRHCADASVAVTANVVAIVAAAVKAVRDFLMSSPQKSSRWATASVTLVDMFHGAAEGSLNQLARVCLYRRFCIAAWRRDHPR